MLCVCDGVAIPNNQTYITEKWLRSLKVSLIYHNYSWFFLYLSPHHTCPKISSRALLTFESAHHKTYNKTCGTSLIRVFTDRLCLLQPPGYPKRDKWEPSPYWADPTGWSEYSLVTQVLKVLSCMLSSWFHYENTPIRIYWKFYHQKMKIFR